MVSFLLASHRAARSGVQAAGSDGQLAACAVAPTSTISPIIAKPKRYVRIIESYYV